MNEHKSDRCMARGSITYIETDIDCTFCLADVKDALSALADVEDVRYSSPGCFEVTHDTDDASLLGVVTTHGHRLVVTENGEIVMGSATGIPHLSCYHRRRSEQRDEEQ